MKMSCSVFMLTAFLLLDFLILHGAARSLGSHSSNSSSTSGTTVHIHKLKSIGDVTVGSNRNLNRDDYVSMGRMPRYSNTRALFRFEPIPESCKFVAKAEMSAYYYRAYLWHRYYYSIFSFDPKMIEVRQIFSDWNETEATWLYRLAGQTWKKPGMELNDTDAAKEAEEERETIHEHTKLGYIKFDITSIAQRWTAGDEDFGVLLTLSDEISFGRQIHLFSREAEDLEGYVVKPYLKVTCWSDFCAPLSQRRGGKGTTLEDEKSAQEESTQEGKKTQGGASKRISSGGVSFTLPANSYKN